LAKVFRDADAALNSLRCGNNPGVVGELDEYGRLTPDVHVEVFRQLTNSLKTSQVTDVDFSSCGIGAVSVNHLSDWVRDATAASVQVIKLDGNPIGCPSKVSLNPGAVTGVVKKGSFDYAAPRRRWKGVFAAVNGRFGEVDDTLRDHTEDYVKVRYVDDGTASTTTHEDTNGWVRVDLLTSVVASRTDLIEDYSHIRALGEALSGAKVKQISLADTKFSSATLTEFVQSVRWETAALNSLRCGNNPGMVGELDMRGRLKTPDAHAEVFKQLTDSLKTSQVTDVDFSSCGIGAAALGHLSDWVRDATAAVKKVSLSQNFLFGSKVVDYETVHDTDADQTGWSSLCDSLKGSSIEELVLADIGMGVKGVAALVEAIKFMATLTSISCLMNPIGEEGLATLVAAVKDSSVRSICGLTDGQDTAADFSGMGLKPFDLKILKAEFDFSGAIAAVTKVDIRHAAIDEEALDTFKGAVPEGCDVVWEPPDDDDY
jgi:hypothetical protein